MVRAIRTIAKEKGILPNPDQREWASDAIPYSLKQLRKAFPKHLPYRPVTEAFRKEFGFRAVFTVEEAAKGSKPLDIKEVLELRSQLIQVQRKLRKEFSLN